MSSNSTLDELYRLAEEKYKQVGFEAHVFELLTPYVLRRPDHSRAWFIYGRALLILSRRREAEQALLKALEDVPNDRAHSVYLGLATLYDSGGSHAAAEEYYRRAVTTSKGSRIGWLWILRGCNLAVSESFDEAIQVFLTALELPDTHQDEAYLNLGYNYRVQRRYQLAANAFQSALDLTPTYDEAREALNGLAGIQESIYLAHSFGSDPGTSPMLINPTLDDLYHRAKEKHRQARFEAHVVELLTPYVAERADHAHAWYLYGDALRVLGRRTEAEQALLKALEGAPHGVVHALYVRLAMLQNSRGRHEVAEGYYRLAVETTGSDLGWLWMLRAGNLMELEKYDEAISAYLTALQLPEEDHDAAKNRGRLGHREAYLNLGCAYRALRNYDLAARAFQSALDLDPTWDKAREALEGLAGIQESIDLATSAGEKVSGTLS
jgi:tetratricopeptide (TPR) repeat protein